MDCKALRERISDFLDGQVQDSERREIAAHLDACESCRVEVQAYQKVVDLVKDLPLVSAPDGFAESVLERAMPGRTGLAGHPAALPARISSWLPVMRGAAAAAVILLFTYVGYQVVQKETESRQPPAGRELGSRDPATVTAKRSLAGADLAKEGALQGDVGPLELKAAALKQSFGRSEQRAGEEAADAEAGAPGQQDSAEELARDKESEKWKSDEPGLKEQSQKDSPKAAAPEQEPGGPEGAPSAERSRAGREKPGSERTREKRPPGDSQDRTRAKGKSSERKAESPADAGLPVTLVVRASSLEAEQERVASLLDRLAADESRKVLRRSVAAVPSAKPEQPGSPAEDSGESVGKLPDSKDAKSPSPGKPALEAEEESGSATRPAAPGAGGAAPAGSPSHGGLSPAPPSKDGQAGQVSEEAKKSGYSGASGRPASRTGRIEIRMSLSEYRRFKLELASPGSRFQEEPSDRLRAFLAVEQEEALKARKENRSEEQLADRLESEEQSDESDAKDQGRGARLAVGEKLLKAETEPTIVLTINFELDPGPAPAPTPEAQPRAEEKSGREKKD